MGWINGLAIIAGAACLAFGIELRRRNEPVDPAAIVVRRYAVGCMVVGLVVVCVNIVVLEVLL